VILVVAEHREGKLNRATLETIAAAQSAGNPVKVAVLGSGVEGVAKELAAADVAEILAVDDAARLAAVLHRDHRFDVGGAVAGKALVGPAKRMR